MMSNAAARSGDSQAADSITINGTVYRQANVLRYRVSQHERDDARGSLVDGGANGGLLGNDVKISYICNADDDHC